TSATTTRPQDYTAEGLQARGGGAGATIEHYRAARRPCCKEIDDMVYSEKDVRASILIPRQRTFVQELKLENHPEQHIRGVPSSNSISHFL
ncbi:hypothetical protein Tco_1011407, partial [Tanacetum coccineum]